MSSHWVFHDCDDIVKQEMTTYWAKKWPRLAKLLSGYPEALIDVRLTAHHRHHHERHWYDVRTVIHLPSGTLVAEASDKSPRAVLDSLADTMAAEIKRHKELVRKDYVFKRKNRRREDLSAAGPLLSRDRKAGQQEDFFRLLRPLLGYLRDHARRELRMLELDGLLHRGEVTVNDVLDELITRAWDQFESRPPDMPLDLWLVDLLHDTFEGLIKQEWRPHLSLEDKAGEKIPAEVPQVDDQEWWAWLLGYDDDEILEDEVPGRPGDRPDQPVEFEDEQEHVLKLVSQLPDPLRQTFVLYALEDYTPSEIAMIQDRPEDQVRADIGVARRILRERLRSGQEQHTDATAAVNAGSPSQAGQG